LLQEREKEVLRTEEERVW